MRRILLTSASVITGLVSPALAIDTIATNGDPTCETAPCFPLIGYGVYDLDQAAVRFQSPGTRYLASEVTVWLWDNDIDTRDQMTVSVRDGEPLVPSETRLASANFVAPIAAPFQPLAVVIQLNPPARLNANQFYWIVLESTSGSLDSSTWAIARPGNGWSAVGLPGDWTVRSTAPAPAFTIRGDVDTTPACVADVDDGSGTGTPDGGVTIEDLLFYLVVFGDGNVRADVDNGSGTGTPDGGVTIEDLLYFLLRFEAGC